MIEFDKDKPQPVYFDLAFGTIIREGNAVVLNLSFNEIKTLLSMNPIDRIDAVLDILDMNRDIEVALVNDEIVEIESD